MFHSIFFLSIVDLEKRFMERIVMNIFEPIKYRNVIFCKMLCPQIKICFSNHWPYVKLTYFLWKTFHCYIIRRYEIYTIQTQNSLKIKINVLYNIPKSNWISLSNKNLQWSIASGSVKNTCISNCIRVFVRLRLDSFNCLWPSKLFNPTFC